MGYPAVRAISILSCMLEAHGNNGGQARRDHELWDISECGHA